MQTSNPFPGMHPYLENHWPGVHTRLIAYVCDAIAPNRREIDYCPLKELLVLDGLRGRK